MLIIASIFIGTVLRTVALSSFPFFTDEAIYTYWAQAIGEGTLRPFIPIHDGKTVLYVWSIIPLLKLGLSPFIAGRVVSVIAATMSMIILALIGKRTIGKYAWIPVLLYSLNPYLVFFDRMAIMDPMMTLFALVSIYGALRLIQTPRFQWAALAGLFLALSFATKPTTQLVAPWYMLFAIYLVWKHRLRGIFYSLTLLLPVAVSYLLVITSSGGEAYQYKSAEFVYPLFTASGILWNNILKTLPDLTTSLTSFVTPITFAFFVMGTIASAARHKWTIFLLSLCVTGTYLLLALYGRIVFSRHIYFLLPLALISVSYALIVMYEWRKLAGYLCGALLIITYAVFSYRLIASPTTYSFSPTDKDHYVTGTASGYGLQETIDFLKKQGNDATVITTRNFGNFPYSFMFALKNPVIGTWDIASVNISSLNKPVFVVDTSDTDKTLNVGSKVFVVKKPEGRATISVYRVDD